MDGGGLPSLPLRNFQRPADAPSGVIIHFPVTRYRRCLPIFGISPDGMSPAFPIKFTAVEAKMSLPISPLYAKINSSCRVAEFSFSANSRFTSSTICKASLRFSRASSNVAPCVCTPGISSIEAAHLLVSGSQFHDLILRHLRHLSSLPLPPGRFQPFGGGLHRPLINTLPLSVGGHGHSRSTAATVEGGSAATTAATRLRG